MMRIENKPVKSILREYGVRLKKRLGQNVLHDEETLSKVVRAAQLNKDDLVIEVGAGVGILTQRLAHLAEKVVAIELDDRLCAILRERLAELNNVEIIQADILKVNLKNVLDPFRNSFLTGLEPLDIQSPTASIKVVANLPYYITTPIIMHLLKQKSIIQLLAIMVQKEVAERIVAEPGNKQYGALSIACQYHCEVELIAWVSKRAFFPEPKVDSALVRMIVWKGPRARVEDEDFFFSLVRASFGQRRKMLENALYANLGFGREKLRRHLKEAGIDGRRRAETLSIEEFARLSNTLAR